MAMTLEVILCLSFCECISNLVFAVNIRNPVFGNRNHNYYFTLMNYWSVTIKVIR